jgi:dolichol-phosphate mannosyltransferase
LNEVENIDPFVERLEAALVGIRWELVFVDDDSADGTADYVRAISRRRPEVRVIQRVGRSGLASACIEGMLATAAPYLAVMDADLQHDETILRRMLEVLKQGKTDVVVGSRHVSFGSMGAMPPHRRMLSRLGAKISTAVCRCSVSDPMSGYFAVTRSYFEDTVHHLSGIGFKILVDLLASSPGRARVQEVPYDFRNRMYGTSKLDISTGIEYFLLITDKIVGDIAPARFVGFVVVGSIGVVLNLAIVTVAYRRAGLPFLQAQALATLVAMVSNFFINNATTYRDIRLRSWRMLTGLVAYCVVCTFGAIGNIALAQFLVDRGIIWYLAAISGLLIGSVWNYGATYAFTWRMLRSRVAHRRPTI